MSQLIIGAGKTERTEVYQVSPGKRRSLAGKKLFSSVIFHFLYHGLDVLYQRDERVRKEIEEWEEGFAWGIGMGEGAPVLYMRKTEKGLLRLSSKEAQPESMDLMIRFKSVDSAFQVMSGQVGVAGSYARHGFVLKGDIARAMSVVRCMDLAEAYLFPRWITRRILKELPEKRMGLFRTYLAVISHMMVH
ncbi:MAG: hypothetical protein HFI63_07480 [Lachnospiraceae bacterium]|nr:hypothetical protein [Lachnospiraceae bacterium]